MAKIITNRDFETLADFYFEESQSQSYFPSQIFFDCYTNIAKNVIHPAHISYVYDSFRSKATAYERSFLQCSELQATGPDKSKCVLIFGMIAGNQHASKNDDYYAEIRDLDSPLVFEQLVNVSIDSPNIDVVVGRQGIDARIYNSSIFCKHIIWKTASIAIESFQPEGCTLSASDGFMGESVNIDISHDFSLRVCAPNLNNYYRLIPYRYDFEDTSSYDIIRYIHAIRCILVEFRTHRKDSLAKTAERIEFVTVGNSAIKRMVLNYLKDCGIIYSDAHLYKINEAKMQEKGINFSALSRMDTIQLDFSFRDFCKWAETYSI